MAVHIKFDLDTTYNRTKIEVLDANTGTMLEMHSFAGACSFNFTGIEFNSAPDITDFVITINSVEDKLFICKASEVLEINSTTPSISDIRAFATALNGALPLISNVMAV